MLDAGRQGKSDDWPTFWAEEVLRALAGLARALHGGRLTEPVVHKSRRELKRLRSLLRLAPKPVAELAKETRAASGEMRRRLGASRDSAVMLDTLAHLSLGLADAADRIKPVLSANHRAAAAALDRSPRRADHDRIVGLYALWRGQLGRVDNTDLLARAVKTYRLARKRAKALGDNDGALHSLRQAAVDHQYQLAFFSAGDKEFLGGRIARMKRLRGRLGECHDLEILREFVRGRSDVSAADLIRLEKVMDERRAKLVRKAAAIAEKLFKDKPRRFRKRLAHATARRPAERRAPGSAVPGVQAGAAR